MRKSSRRSDQRMPPRADATGAQVQRLEPGCVYEDLEQRAGERRIRDARRVELQHDTRRRRVARRRLEPIGAQRREHQMHHAAQDPVLVERGDRIQRGFELVDEPVGVALAVEPGVEPRHEQFDERAGDVGMCGERFRHIGVAVQRADLAQVAAVRAQQRHLAPREPGEDDEPVEPVVFDRTRKHREERILEQVADRARRDRVRGTRSRKCLIHRRGSPRGCMS